MLEAETLLHECSDLVLALDGGRTLRANKFTMLMHCKFLQRFHADFKVSGTLRIPDIDYDMLRVTVDIIHGVRATAAELSLLETVQCLAGFDFLECTIPKTAVVSRLWTHVSALRDHADIARYARYFLDLPAYRSMYLELASCRTWSQFRVILEDLTIGTAVELMSVLPNKFCAFFVFRDLLAALAPVEVTQASVMRLLGSWRAGVFYHPHEMMLALRHAKVFCAARDDFDRCFTDMLDNIAISMDDCEQAPLCKTPGTTLTLPRPLMTTTLTRFDGSGAKRTVIVRATRFLKIAYNLTDGEVDADINTREFASDALHVRVSVVVMVLGALCIHEIHYSVAAATAAGGVVQALSAADALSPPEEREAFARALRDPRIQFARFDVIDGTASF